MVQGCDKRPPLLWLLVWNSLLLPVLVSTVSNKPFLATLVALTSPLSVSWSVVVSNQRSFEACELVLASSEALYVVQPRTTTTGMWPLFCFHSSQRDSAVSQVTTNALNQYDQYNSINATHTTYAPNKQAIFFVLFSFILSFCHIFSPVLYFPIWQCMLECSQSRKCNKKKQMQQSLYRVFF